MTWLEKGKLVNIFYKYINYLLLEDYENLNSMDYALKELDKFTSDIFIYTDAKKFNKPVTIIQGLNDKEMVKTILRDLKKNIGTGGTYKNGIIILQGNHQEYVKKYLINKNIIKKFFEIVTFSFKS